MDIISTLSFIISSIPSLYINHPTSIIQVQTHYSQLPIKHFINSIRYPPFINHQIFSILPSFLYFCIFSLHFSILHQNIKCSKLYHQTLNFHKNQNLYKVIKPMSHSSYYHQIYTPQIYSFANHSLFSLLFLFIFAYFFTFYQTLHFIIHPEHFYCFYLLSYVNYLCFYSLLVVNLQNKLNT